MKTKKTAVETNAFYCIGAHKSPRKNAGETVSFPGIGERKLTRVSELRKAFLSTPVTRSTSRLKRSSSTGTPYDLSSGTSETSRSRILDVQDFVRLKRLMMERGASGARIASVVYAMRSFLSYCGEFLKIQTLQPKQIRPPKIFRREVVLLTKDEIERFIATIDIEDLVRVPIPCSG